MKRLALLFVAAALAGCRSQAQPSDPFLRTTVPPPTTGQGAPGGSQPYYSPSGGGNSSGAGSSAPAGNKYTPPGGSFNYQQTSNSPASSDGEGSAAVAGQQSADALGTKLAATVDALDDPPPVFNRAPSSGVTTPVNVVADPDYANGAVQLAAHTTVADSNDTLDPPPVPSGNSAGRATSPTHDVVETGHHEEHADSGGGTVIRILGTQIVNEPRTAAEDAQFSETHVASSTTAEKVAEPAAEIGSLPGLKWRKTGLAGQSYEGPAQFDRALTVQRVATGN
jgi:hypothetical protein